MIHTRAMRWLLLAAASLLATGLMLALIAGPSPAGAQRSPDTATISRLIPRAGSTSQSLPAPATITDTYAAILAAETLLSPALTDLFLPLAVK